MGSHRKLVAYAAIGLVVGGHLFDLVADREHWPFSTYPMYSYRLGERFHVYRVVGVLHDDARDHAGDGAGGELPLVQRQYLRPFDFLTLGNGLAYLNKKPDRERRLEAALHDCLARYEARRALGHHDGPRLRALRFYRMSWDLDPKARNANRPDRQELLYEVAARETSHH